MKKLSKRATDFIELFFKTDINRITLNRHDIDVLYSHYKYSWFEFDKMDKQIEYLQQKLQRKDNIINSLEKWLNENNLYNTNDNILNKIKELKENE